MQLVLEKRAERSNLIALISPLIAIGLTIVTMSILFAILGKNPISALGVYFIDPLTDSYSLQELAVKAAPLVMIGESALCQRYALAFSYLGQPVAAVLDNTAPVGLWNFAVAAGLLGVAASSLSEN